MMISDDHRYQGGKSRTHGDYGNTGGISNLRDVPVFIFRRNKK